MVNDAELSTNVGGGTKKNRFVTPGGRSWSVCWPETARERHRETEREGLGKWPGLVRYDVVSAHRTINKALEPAMLERKALNQQR